MQTKIEKIDSSSALAVKIIDSLCEKDFDFLSFREKLTFANISHPEKKKEWGTARLAVQGRLTTYKFLILAFTRMNTANPTP